MATETACFTSYAISSFSCSVKTEMSYSAFSGALSFVIKGMLIAALQLSLSQESASTFPFNEIVKRKVAHPCSIVKAIILKCILIVGRHRFYTLNLLNTFSILIYYMH